MLQSVLILVLVQRLVSSQGENEACDKRVQEAKNFGNLIPDRKQLLSICPGAKLAIECEIELLSLPDEDYKLELLNTDKEVINELCDENSQFHKAYGNIVQCYRSMTPEWPDCKVVAHAMYLDYRTFFSDTEDKNIEELDEEEKEYRDNYIKYYEPVCLESAYQISCLGIKIQETCGTEAHDAFVKLVQLTRSVKKFCSEDAAMTLQNKFLNFLATEKEHAGMDTVRSLFNFERK